MLWLFGLSSRLSWHLSVNLPSAASGMTQMTQVSMS